ncbi:MAG: hypothetical protein C5B54_03280, partial [Acidobacteria bacterium]
LRQPAEAAIAQSNTDIALIPGGKSSVLDLDQGRRFPPFARSLAWSRPLSLPHTSRISRAGIK